MSHTEALKKIIAEAEEYGRNRERFKQAEGLPDCHIGYREGVRDGKNQAARIAQQALGGEKC